MIPLFLEFLDQHREPAVVVLVLLLLLVFVMSAMVLYRIGAEYAQGDDMAVSFTPPATAMEQVYNPYVLRLKDASTACLSDGATLELTSHLPCVIRAFWGVRITSFFPAIYQPWSQFSTTLYNGTLLEGDCLASSNLTTYDHCDEVAVTLAPPSEVVSRMGAPPRYRYPLVVVLALPERTEAERQEIQENQIVCVVMLLHLRDDACSAESSVMGHYVRTVTRPPYNMQHMFVNADDEAAADRETNRTSPTLDVTSPSDTVTSSADTQSAQMPPDYPSTSSNTGGSSSTHGSCALSGAGAQPGELVEDEDMTSQGAGCCVVCQASAVTRVLLPCRHACVCHECFTRVTQCPMCRSHIISYFSLSGSHPMNDGMGEDEEDEMDPDLVSDRRFVRWNAKINHFMGFR